MKYVYALRTVDSFLFGVLVGRNSTNNQIATEMQRNLHKIYLLPTTKRLLMQVFTTTNNIL